MILTVLSIRTAVSKKVDSDTVSSCRTASNTGDSDTVLSLWTAVNDVSE